MTKKQDTAQEYEDNFEKLNEELNELAEMIRQFAKSSSNYKIKPQVKQLLGEVLTTSKKIGGSILDHATDLKLDINLFLNQPNTKGLTPKIFQDFQILKNDLRRL